MPSRKDLANAIRALSMDAVQKANSGHPGAPMGMADIAEVLWNDFLRHSPTNPHWPNRDRFVLSNGHGSMLQYSLLHLSGYDLGLRISSSSVSCIRARRAIRNTAIPRALKPPPARWVRAWPMPWALPSPRKPWRAQFNRDGFEVVDHHTYVFLGDGCLMEGISHEVCSLAGTLGLGKLICVYDDNGISIDGEVEGWFTDDTPKRFEAYGWQVIADVDGHDPEAVRQCPGSGPRRNRAARP